MTFDDTIVCMTELRQSLDEALADVMDMDYDEPSSDDFVLIQKLFRRFVGSSQKIVDEYIAVLRSYNECVSKFHELERTATANTAEMERIMAAMR